MPSILTFATEALRFNAPASHPPTTSVNIAEHNQHVLTLIQQAQSAALREEAPDSPTVQAVVDAWINLMASFMQRSITPAFLHELATQASISHSERMQRFWNLMALLSGREAPPSYKEGFDLLTAGLDARLSQEEPLHNEI